ncbi:MAG TPA: hypothetical protein VLA47_06480 [Nitrospira sp.]|nr:hypothetical protein [Nitrospira sp.]
MGQSYPMEGGRSSKEVGGEALKTRNADRHTDPQQESIAMHDAVCCVPYCQARPYAPAGTRSVCKNHFFTFLTWRRRRGPQMFHTYAAMTMKERDSIVAEWVTTIRIDEVPASSTQKS